MAVDIFNTAKTIPLNPTSATNGATITSGLIDCIGHESLVLDIIASTADVVSDSPSVLKLQEADVTNTSSFADITAAVGGGAGGFTIPAGVTATTTQVYFTFEVDLRQRKRYLRLLVSPRTTQTYSALATFGRNKTVPISASDRGVSGYVDL